MRPVSVCSLVLALAGCTQTPAERGDEQDTETETETPTESESETGPEPDAWQIELQIGEDGGALMSVWGESPTDVFAVGGQPEPGGGQVVHFDGEAWIAESLPDDVGMLNWVYGVDGLVWSVGIDGVIVRRDAGVWEVESSPTDRVLWGVWGASADELWSVGGDGVVDQPVLLRRDGATSEWTVVELPPLETDAHALFKLWGTAANDIWAVGDAGATLHFDGATWTANPDPDAIDLISVWGSPSEGLVAVGGRASGRVDRFGGDGWSGQTLAIPGLNGVWVDPELGATAVGVQGTIVRLSAGGYEIMFEDSGTSMVLHAVFGFAGGPRYAVGGSLLMPAPFVGVILRAD